jgi:hypothetical protein
MTIHTVYVQVLCVNQEVSIMKLVVQRDVRIFDFWTTDHSRGTQMSCEEYLFIYLLFLA